MSPVRNHNIAHSNLASRKVQVYVMEPRYGFTADRYLGQRKRKFRMMDCILLTGALIVILVCGLWILLHTAIKGSRYPHSRLAGTEYRPTFEHKTERLTSDQCHEVCTTEDCLKTAAGMLGRMDSGIDPCEDFYGFSCGKYDKVSMDETKREQFLTDVAEEVLNVVIGVIGKMPKHLPETVPGYSASKARNLYESCMDFRSTEEMAIPTALKYLEYFGIKNWPHLSPNYEFTSPDVDEVMARLTLYEANPFFSLNILQTDEAVFKTDTSTERARSDFVFEAQVEASGRSLLLSNLFSKEQLTLGMRNILDYFGMSDEAINSTIEDAFTVDKALEDIKQLSRKRIMVCTRNSSVSCVAYQFDCTQEKNPEMERWCTIIMKVMEAVGMREKYSRFNIILQDKFYFEDVRNLIASANHRAIAHGLALEFLLENSMIMSFHFRRTAVVHIFPKGALDKLQVHRPFFCANWVLVHVPTLVAAAFYSAKYKGELQQEGNDMYRDIQQNIISLTKNMTWMDLEAQESLENLMRSVNMTIEYHVKHVSNASEVDQFHKKLHITEESFLSNAMEYKRFRTSVNFLHSDNTSMVMTRLRSHFQLQPKYLWEIIYVDFASFIYPLISIDRPRYSNLGTFGFFLSHEYSHGVEIFLREPKNMSSSFENALEIKKKCLIDQYSQYEIDIINEKVNGSLTLHENMADFFAIRPAYQAMKKYQEQHGGEKTLPGLRYNVEQLFFISVAQFMCESNTPETLKTYLNDPHSPNKHRVLGMLKNFEPFSEVFNCPSGSPMNPVEKCRF